jgi:prepilin-type N-terminal cleavage/methylation domain-containing protein
MTKRQHGYSLIEVLIAIAITAVVLLTVITMFYMGRRNVYSGKQMTVASSVGTRILEDISTMTAQDMRTYFNLTNTSLGTVTLDKVAGVGQMTYSSAAARDTSSCSVNSTTGAIDCGSNDVKPFYMANWYRMIVPGTDVSATLANPTIGIIFQPRNPTNIDPTTGAAGNFPVTTAQFVKIRVYVAWDQSKSFRRYAFFDTTRVSRQ